VSNFIDLHCHSTFSCAMTSGDAYGTPQRIVDRAVDLGWSAACLTDHGWMGGIPAFYKACKAAKIKPILGVELYVTSDMSHGIRGKEVDGFTFHLTVLALSREGYENLVAWSSEAMLRENYHRKPRISVFRMAELAPHGLHHNVVLSGCLASELCRTISSGQELSAPVQYIEQMKMLFPNFYIEVQDHTVPKLAKNPTFETYQQLLKTEEEMRTALLALASITNTPVILTNDSHMQHPQDRKAHIALKASSWRSRDDGHYGSSTSQISATYLRDYAYYGNYMRDMERIAERAGLPQAALNSIHDIVEEADIRLEPLDSFGYSLPTSGYASPVEKIRRRCAVRLRHLLAKHGDVARIRFEHELESMADFADYLLLMSDFIIAARKQGILTWTRGSAANSLLCYCLKIHELDSIEFGLTFSRFFNPARKKLPDIDIDIQPDRYSDFMRIVQEHMEPLIGAGQVVQVCNWGTAANRRAFRMAASALGMPKEQQDEISKLLPQMIDSGMVDEDTDVFLALREDYPELYEISSDIFDSITSVSQHACAWAFGTPDRPASQWIPMYLIASSGTLVTQYDFKTVEEFGLVKGDFLRLRTLEVAAKVMQMIGKSPLDFHKIPLDDEETFEMIRRGDVEGVHTLQGKETRKGLLDVQPETVHDLILTAALYRPANTREGKNKLYLDRKQGLKFVEYPHKLVEEILGPTQGVPVFQEQAMEIAYGVGMDDAGVDDIYQAIKKAKGVGRGAKEAFGKIKPVFMEAALKIMSRQQALETWEYVKGFQGYGFNKGHATSYGVLADRMAYLACHHTAEFYTALLDVYPEKPAYIAAARNKFNFLTPCVNRSGAGYTLDRGAGNSIRVGLAQVKDVGPVAVKEITAGQPFNDMEDFRSRTTRRAVNVKRVTALAQVGALDTFGISPDGDEDEAQFSLLGFTLRRPKVFRGCKPKFTRARTSESGWRHLGRERGLELTGTRKSVSKLFWIPPGTKLELQASPWANVECWLLTVVDENGLPFHLIGPDDRKDLKVLLKFLHKQCQGRVVCMDGMVRLPFKQNGPQGFRVFQVTGTYADDPQIFPSSKSDLKYVKAAQSLRQYGNQQATR
jgi:DNA polymerase III subunit alpha